MPAARAPDPASDGPDLAARDPHAMLLQRVALIERSILKGGAADEKAMAQLEMLKARIAQMSSKYDQRFEAVRERNARAQDSLSGLSEKLAQGHEGYGRVGGRSCPPAPSSGWHATDEQRRDSSAACSTAASTCSSRDATPAARCGAVEMTPPRRWHPGAAFSADSTPPRAGSDLSMNPSSQVSSCFASLGHTPPTPTEVQDTPSPPWPLWPEFEASVGSQIGSLLRLRPDPREADQWQSPKCSEEEDLLLYQATSLHAAPASDPYAPGAGYDLPYDLPHDWGLC